MARVIHIAVNLLLIVAVAMQPGMVYELQQSCFAGVSSALTCNCCGSCKVQSRTAECPCCTGGASNKEEKCCGQSQGSGDVAIFDDDPFAGIELAEGPVPEGAPSATSVAEDLKTDNEVVFRGHIVGEAVFAPTRCHCVTAPEPFSAPLPRPPLSELREVLTADIACVGVVITPGHPSLSSCFEFARRPIEPHFSQIAFCVWRL